MAKITLKKRSSPSASDGSPADAGAIAAPQEGAELSPRELTIEPTVAMGPRMRNRKALIWNVAFTVMGVCALILFVTLVCLQVSEKSWYDAAPSLWLK